MLTHKQLRTKALGNAEVKAEYEKLSDEYALLDEFLKARAAQGLTQAQVAEKIGTMRSAVARMESGSELTTQTAKRVQDVRTGQQKIASPGR